MDQAKTERDAEIIRSALLRITMGSLAATDEHQSFLAGVLHGLTVALGRAELVEPDDLPHL